MVLIYILIATLVVSFIAFAGVFTLLLGQKILNRIILFLVAFSAGTLMGSAFLHLLAEAVEEAEDTSNVFFFAILGFCSLFVLEQFIFWHHCHKDHCEETGHKTAPFSYSILLSDAIHNFLDGLIIAASFIVSVPLGIAATLAVAFHEIPQEISDFGVLIYGGFKRSTALIFNFISGLVAVAGGVAGFFLMGRLGSSVALLLAFAAGNFIYIAASDLIPEIKKRENYSKSSVCFLIFILGIAFMALLKD